MRREGTLRGLLGAALVVGLAIAGCHREPPGDGPDVPPAGACCATRPRPADDNHSPRSRRGPEDRLGELPLPITPRSHPRLGFPAHGSISVGTLTDGYLVDGAVLPLSGPHHRVLPVQSLRRTNYGATEMINLITGAAAAVAAEYPGAVLDVGNIAKGGGGDLPWSVSHNTGLDADLGFYLIDAEGRAVRPETLVHIAKHGRCVELPDCRLDVPRTWSLVAALLANDEAVVQWLFVARHIKERLLARARELRAPRSLVTRATEVLHQPGGALPHDDHLHVRLYCPREDLLEGCRNRGPERPEAPAPGKALGRRIAALRRLTRHSDPARRAGALEVLRILAARSERGLFVRALADPAPEVRDAALRGAATLRVGAAIPAIGHRLADEPDPHRRWRQVDALAAIGGVAGRRALIGLLGDKRTISRGVAFDDSPDTVQRRCARVLGQRGSKEATRALVDALDALDAREPAFRNDIRQGLRLLTNHAFADEPGDAAVRAWRRWWTQNRRRSQDRWLTAGFRAAGYAVRGLDRKALPALLDAVLDERPWISRNARRALGRISGRDAPSVAWSRGDAHAYWTRWCTRRLGERACRP